jgi:hypothetical protein
MDNLAQFRGCFSTKEHMIPPSIPDIAFLSKFSDHYVGHIFVFSNRCK